MRAPLSSLAVGLAAALTISATPLHSRDGQVPCVNTKVVILGAGTAGITAAQALTNASISDFVIVEYQGQVGGRVAHTNFGKRKDGKPFVVELGANVQGLVSPGGPENPIWTLAKKYKLKNTFSDYSSIQTFNETGAFDFKNLLTDYTNAYTVVAQDAGRILTDSIQDRNVRAGFSLVGWKPARNMAAQAVEWWNWDWEYAYNPEQSSQLYGIVNYNTTFYQYSAENNFVFDRRGFSAFLQGEASTFLAPNDPRLLLNTVVTNVSHSDSGVTVYNKDGSCIQAEYAICTFSLGVLQNDAVKFSPALPGWKQKGIATFEMGTYTKIFMQFPFAFWDTKTQFFLYADPFERGYFPVFQSLDGPGFLPGSGILFVTVVQSQSYKIEQQNDETTKQQVLAVLRKMYPHTYIPDPIDFMYPRWSLEKWAYGSYSNWPPGTTLEMHQNLRANVGRLWFAGEATSAEYFGFLQGAYFEGKSVATQIAGCLNGHAPDCSSEKRYPGLRGSTNVNEYTAANGWTVSSFSNFGAMH